MSDRGWERFEPVEPPQPPTVPVLYNVESLGEEPEEVIFVDTVDDVNALIEECDIVNAVSFDGPLASGKLKREDPLSVNWTVLSKAKRVILAGTNNVAGRDRREELAKRFGRHLCRVVEWPEGCVRALETLDKFDATTVTLAIRQADLYPIDGLYRVTVESLVNLRSRQPPETMTTGTESTDEILALPMEGRLIVVTGYPNGGKTSWMRFVMMHTAQKHNRRWAVFSPEMMPWEQFAADCAEVRAGKPFWPIRDKPWVEPMSDLEIAESGAWLSDRLTMIVCDSEDMAPTMSWMLGKARDAVLRDGVTDLLIDPWNEMDHTRPMGMNETDYVGRALQQWKAFIARHGCNVWIIAHPAKPPPVTNGEPRRPPQAYEIAGSAHWANKPDLGITIHSQEVNFTDLILLKCRFRRFGVKNSTARMAYDPNCGRYSTPTDPS